jgi:hypothetical protein
VEDEAIVVLGVLEDLTVEEQWKSEKITKLVRFSLKHRD